MDQFGKLKNLTVCNEQVLTNSPSFQADFRKDRNGNLIKIGSKAHKVTFRDQVQKGEKVADTYEVESYKKYNAIDGTETGDFSCKCLIF